MERTDWEFDSIAVFDDPDATVKDLGLISGDTVLVKSKALPPKVPIAFYASNTQVIYGK